MSFISAKNLVAPLTNMVHLITILLIAICFSVLRLSGASLSIESSAVNATTAASRAANDSNTSQTSEDVELPVFIPKSKTPWDKDNQTTKTAPSKSKQIGGLDDIEKSLGIKK